MWDVNNKKESCNKSPYLGTLNDNIVFELLFKDRVPS